MAATAADKTLEHPDDGLFAVRVAYQTPIQITSPATGAVETAFPYTFEDALALENMAFFSSLEGHGLVRKFRDAIADNDDAGAISKAMYEALRNGKKAEFALDVILAEQFDTLTVPSYIADGLEWLELRLTKKQAEILPSSDGVA